ncbi:MATE family efflux transporter [Ruminococcaceae bacterium OttesenSCG-928-N02]|nr:MATE family efflux transporter [Ruminococcaceae bacterium OttesenSCG-928-N02]
MGKFIERNFITEKNFYKTVFAVVIPIALQNVISFGVNLMDTIMLGRLGDIAISAASMGNQPFFLLMGLGFGLSSGGAVLIAQYWGKGNTKAIRSIMGISMRILLVAAAVFTVACQLFPQEIMSIYVKDPQVIEASAIYLKTLSISFVLYCIATNYMMSMRAVEAVKFSTFISLLSFFVNVFFNYCFIFGNFGFPALGVKGAALGTVIARLAEFGAVMVYMNLIEKKVGFRLGDLLKSDKGLMKDYTKYSLPVVGNELVWSMGSAITAIIIGHISTVFISANSITSVMMQLCSVFIFGISNAAAVVTGKSIGEGKKDQTQKVAYSLLAIALVMGLFGSVLVFLMRDVVLSFYNVSPETRDVARQCMTVLACILPCMALDITCIIGILRGGGDTRTSFMLDAGSLWLVAIPLGAIAGVYLKLAPPLVYLALKMDSPIKAILAGLRVRSGKWVRTVTREDVA